MNGRTAKELRRRVYGDLSLRNPRRYVWMPNGMIRLHPDDPRAAYQQIKRGRSGRSINDACEIRLPYLSQEMERAERHAWRDIVQTWFPRSRSELMTSMAGMLDMASALLLLKRWRRRS